MNNVIQPARKIKGGAKAPHFKRTAEMESVVMPAPEMVVIPMQQHIGAPCKPTVKAGDNVLVGQVIGDTDAFVSAPIHSSISGKVKSIGSILLSNGKKCDAIYIENDGKGEFFREIRPVEIKSKADLLAAARASGIVGIGGAGFPTHVKLAIKDDMNVDTLIINGAECEPYITSDYRESIESPERIIAGMEMVMKQLNISRGIVGIESNKPQGIAAIKKCLEQNTSVDIDIIELPAMYPHGAEKMLIYAATGRQVPMGGLPSDIGCIVMNITSVSVLYHYISTGKPLFRKRLTVDGGAIKEPKNVFAPIGTRISDIVEFCGGFKGEPTKLLLGGPMMGISQYDLEMPITKQNNAIIALTEKETFVTLEQPCIRCGRCLCVCPMSLMPVTIERSAKIGDTAALKKLSVSNCMECGCCAFACPSMRPLTQYMKDAKNILMRKGTSK